MPTLFGTTPDHRRIQTVLGKGKPDRVPVYEIFSDTKVQLEAVGDWPMDDPLPLGGRKDMDDHIKAQYYLCYDYLCPAVQYGFTGVKAAVTEDSAGKQRGFLDESDVSIKSREDFEKYQWPTPDVVDFSDVEYCAKHAPDGMRLVVGLGGGLLEWGMWLMGTVPFCMAIHDDPDLVRDVLARVNEQQVKVASDTASIPEVMAVCMGDDMGFKTQTFLPPDAMREFIFPGLKKIVDAVHAQGKPFILHSCGNLRLVMDDLIDYCGIDAKHSYEDVIIPVTEAKKEWGSRIATLGGIDIDFLTRATEEEVRKYVRRVVGECAKGGAYAAGSGNSIANYIPPANLRAMIEESIKISG